MGNKTNPAYLNNARRGEIGTAFVLRLRSPLVRHMRASRPRRSGFAEVARFFYSLS
jgi:hypothetical protein